VSIRIGAQFIIATVISSLPLGGADTSRAGADGEVERIVAQKIPVVAGKTGGVAVAVRKSGQTWFFNYGMADRARPITSDVLFNLGSVGKVFDSALLTLADLRGELSLDDPVAKHVIELQQGRDIRRITLRQLASYTSGFVLPHDHAPWPAETFTLPEFLATLNSWTSDKDHEPGNQMIYSHAGFVLIHLALERRFDLPFDGLMAQRVLNPLGLSSTTLPTVSSNFKLHPRGEIPEAFSRRAVQGYSERGDLVGAPGDLQGYYHWLGTGQMYASVRDMAVFLAAALGELPGQETLHEAIRRAQRGTFLIEEGEGQALAWEVRPVRRLARPPCAARAAG
jgi:beta-lactamase class C